MKCSSTISSQLLLVLLVVVWVGFCHGEIGHDAGCINIESKAFLEFRRGLIDPSGGLSYWVGEDCCKWRGVICNNRTGGHVIKLKLSKPSSTWIRMVMKEQCTDSVAFDVLLQKLRKYVPYGSSVTDLYAGAGVIGLSSAVTRKCRSVRCVEINKESKLSFEKTVDRLPSSIDSSIIWHHADTSKEPFSWVKGSDVVVVDPPRKGLDRSLLEALQNIPSIERKAESSFESPSSNIKDEKRPWIIHAREASVHIGHKTPTEDGKSLPQTLIYISCGWDSFKEDCRALLSSKAWRLEKARGYNFFLERRGVVHLILSSLQNM